MLLFVSNKDMKYFLSYGAVLFVQILFVLVILRPVLFVQVLFVRIISYFIGRVQCVQCLSDGGIQCSRCSVNHHAIVNN